MDLSIHSALSPGGLVGHLAYILTVAAMLMRSMVWLRILYIASVLVGILYLTFWVDDPVGLFWKVLLVAVNIGMLVSLALANGTARFTQEERAFAASLLRGLEPGEARRLLDRGEWLDLPDSAVLTSEGKRPDHLYYLARGEAVISVGRRRVARCRAGQYVGEMSVLDQSPASADALTDGPARVWRISRRTLDRLAVRRPKIHAVIEAGIARDMRAKIVQGNVAHEPRAHRHRPAAGPADSRTGDMT